MALMVKVNGRQLTFSCHETRLMNRAIATGRASRLGIALWYDST